MKAWIAVTALATMLAVGAAAWGRAPLESATTRPPLSSTGHVIRTPSVNRLGPVYHYAPVSPIAPQRYIIVPGHGIRSAPRYYHHYQPGIRLEIRTFRSPGGSRLGYYHGGRWYDHYSVPGYRYGPARPLPYGYHGFRE